MPPKYMFIKPKDGEKVPVDDNFSGQGREADGKTNPALWEVYRDVKHNYFSCYLECKVQGHYKYYILQMLRHRTHKKEFCIHIRHGRIESSSVQILRLGWDKLKCIDDYHRLFMQKTDPKKGYRALKYTGGVAVRENLD